MKTERRLIEAAKNLLDQGGESAVTLRSIAQAIGLSHNAPYKHFDDRRSILEAVAIDDFDFLTKMFNEVRRTDAEPIAKLKGALKKFVSYSQNYPARYHLLFSDPAIGRSGEKVQAAAFATFTEFSAIVGECQEVNALPSLPNAELTALIHAAVHGLIDINAGGRFRTEKGFSTVSDGIERFLELIARY